MMIKSFQNTMEITNEKTKHQENLQCLAKEIKEIYIFFHNLSLSIMNDVLRITEKVHNYVVYSYTWSFQVLYSSNKKTPKIWY